MTHPNGHRPAFPLARAIDETMPNVGITKREYFAAMALQGILANSSIQTMSNQYPPSELNNAERVRLAIDHADELLKQLEA